MRREEQLDAYEETIRRLTREREEMYQEKIKLEAMLREKSLLLDIAHKDLSELNDEIVRLRELGCRQAEERGQLITLKNERIAGLELQNGVARTHLKNLISALRPRLEAEKRHFASAHICVDCAGLAEAESFLMEVAEKRVAGKREDGEPCQEKHPSGIQCYRNNPCPWHDTEKRVCVCFEAEVVLGCPVHDTPGGAGYGQMR